MYPSVCVGGGRCMFDVVWVMVMPKAENRGWQNLTVHIFIGRATRNWHKMYSPQWICWYFQPATFPADSLCVKYDVFAFG